MKISLLLYFIVVIFVVLSDGLMFADNGLGKTPQIGWNSNFLGCDINQSYVMQTIDFMVSKGWSKLGYTYIALDDCWQNKSRDPITHIVYPDRSRFPMGFQYLAQYAHDNGFKFGLYSDAGFYTCYGLPGSFGYEAIDAQAWASWGVDYLKYDNCYSMNVTQGIVQRYTVMSDSLLATGRPIFYSMCEWGWGFPGTWAPKIANSWRTTGDIPTACWECVWTYVFINDVYAPYAGPGGWNDPDMLQVGALSPSEGRAQYSLWAIMKAPLIQSASVLNLTIFDYETMTNPEVIAINQDPLGVQGRIVDAQWPAQIGDYPTIDIPVLAPCNGDLGQSWEYTSDQALRERKTQRYLSMAQPNVPTVLPYANYSSDWAFSNGFLGRHGRVLMRFERTNHLVLETVLNSTDQLFYYNYSDSTIRWAQDSSLCVTPNNNPPLLVLASPLVNNGTAVALFNPLDAAQYMTVYWQKVGVRNATRCAVRDVWENENMGYYYGQFTTLVQALSVTLLKLIPS